MIKKLFITVIALVSVLTINAQEGLKYQEVILFDGVQKEELMTSVKAWIAQKFTANSDKYSEDKNGGLYVIKNDFNYVYERKVSPVSAMYKASGNVYYRITIEVKDNKVRFSLSDFIHKGANSYFHSFGLITNIAPSEDSKKWIIATWNDVNNQAKEEFDILKKLFIEYIGSYSSDW